MEEQVICKRCKKLITVPNDLTTGKIFCPYCGKLNEIAAEGEADGELQLATTVAPSAQAGQVDNDKQTAKQFKLKYDKKKGGYIVVKGKDKKATEIVIPNTYKGKPIVGVAKMAFYNEKGAWKNLTSVVIGDSVTSIGDWAFSGCSSLTSVVIGDSVTSIGVEAFSDCSSLTELTLPFVGASKDATGHQAVLGYIFGYRRTSSSSAISGATYQYYDSLSSPSYEYYHYYIPTSLKKVTITGGDINAHAFKNCSSLTSVVISNSVTSIGEGAFAECYRLGFGLGFGRVVIGNSVTSIGDHAFLRCGLMSEVVIPDSVTSIGEGAFAECGLTSVVIPDSVTSIGEGAFSHCYGLKSVVIGDSVTSIGARCFSHCSRLTSVVIGDSVTIIGRRAFNACSELTSVTIPKSVKIIVDAAFEGDEGLKVNITDLAAWCSIEFLFPCIGDDSPRTPTETTKRLYLNGEIVTDLVIPVGVKEIAEYAFYGCDSLTSVVIPKSVERIGASCFSSCSRLTSVEYQGTKKEWVQIVQKKGVWSSIPTKKVKCTDGEVLL